jgi:ABC-type transporter Mla subunit MlaD
MVAAGKALETAVGLTAEIVKSISTFNDTMTEMNKVAHRVNALLDEIEEPVRDMVPLVQLSLKQAKSTLKKVDKFIFMLMKFNQPFLDQWYLLQRYFHP